MFHNNNSSNTSGGGQNSDSMMSSMMRNLQTPPFVSPMDQQQQQQQQQQHASIIRNENGMYTIRNPAFQSIFSGGGSSSGSPGNGYGNGMMSSNSNGSAFMPSNSSNFMSHPSVASNSSNMGNSSSYAFESDYNQPNTEAPKCSSVIGSEMKNVLQRRKEQEFIDWNQGMRSQYSHFGTMAFNGNSHDDGFGRPARPSSSNSGCYNSYPSPTMASYDDLRLQPGKMLNSEVRKFSSCFSKIYFQLSSSLACNQVTIHNVTESKFFQNQKTQAPIGTPRNVPTDTVIGGSSSSGSGGPKLFGDLVQPALGSRPHAPVDYNGN
jgi:hypothetical protein